MDKQRDLRKDNSGSIVVEACLSLIIFIAAIASIISLINVYIVHNRIQFALNSAANQIASYSYLYEMSPVGEAVETLHSDGDSYIEKYDTVKDAVQALRAMFDTGNMTAGDWQNQINTVYTGAENFATDPYGIAIGALYTGVINGEQIAENGVAMGLGYALTRQYIAPSSLDAVDYLDRHYVVVNKHNGSTFSGRVLNEMDYGLNFSGSTFDHDNGIIVLDATYEVEIPLINFLIPNDYTLTVHQRACAKCWMDGDGNSYPKD